MYQPNQKILEKYADLLVNFALNSGQGVKEDEIVMCVLDDVAKPFLIELYQVILKANAHPMMRMIPTGLDKIFFENANDKQLIFFPENYMKARCETINHQIGIISDDDPHELKDVDSKKIFKSADAAKQVREWLVEKENRGEFTWTLALYGTEAMAKEAGLTLKEYWDVIIEACYLDTPDPKIEWRRILTEQERIKKELDKLEIEWLHVEGEKIDLKVKLGRFRKWMGGSGRNIPSYEIFVSPDWRGTEGYIYFNQPLYRYGNLIKDVKLEFKDGLVVGFDASQGKSVVENMLQRENANKIGEYSLTDSRFSRITKFTANTLFDENMGGEYGNTHLAVGMAYKDSFTGDPSKPTKEEWELMGFNDSPEHTDIISTEDRIVTATLPNGSTKVIYKDGQFTV
ncbi:aminopeptidase [Candidatus Dojkabacteria bacterium]|nr:aminopeptidase [Candidatus Dojkabacteria bacterium]